MRHLSGDGLGPVPAEETVRRFPDQVGAVLDAATSVRRQVGRLARLWQPAASPPGVRGFLDSPAEAVLYRAPVLFQGWALAGSATPASVSVVINGLRTSAEVGAIRPDVPIRLTEPTVTTACGWTASVDLSRVPLGDLTVQVVVAAPGMPERVVCERLFALRGDEVQGFIDLPIDGTVVRGNVLTIRGWAHTVAGVARVDVYVDGENVGPARLGLTSRHAHAHDPTRFGIAGGWSLRFVLGTGPPGPRDIAVTVTDLRSHTTRLGGAKVCVQWQELSESDFILIGELQARTRLALESIPAGGTGTRRCILVFAHSLAIGGAELYLQELLRGIVPSLSTCTVISAYGGILAKELEDLGVDVCVNPRVVPTDIAGYEGAIRELAAFLGASGCTSVLLNTIGLWFVADAAQRVGIPTVWAVHESFEIADWLDLNYGGNEVPAYVRARMDFAIRGTSKMVFESEATRSMYIAAGVPASVTETVPYGVDVDAIAAYAAGRDRASDRTTHDLPIDATILLCMGVFQERKGQLWLVEAFGELLDVHPETMLVLVGDHPAPYPECVHDLIRKKGMEDRVRTVPITPEAWVWYSMADVLISASDVESLPRSMLEAMAFGCPVLAASVHGIPELITDGETGWLMLPRDTRALIAGMHRVLGLTDQTRQAVGAAGRDLVREKHRAGGYVRTYIELIDEVESRPRTHTADGGVAAP